MSTTTTAVEQEFAEIQARKAHEADVEHQAYLARMTRADEKRRENAVASFQRRVARTTRLMDALNECQKQLASLKAEELAEEGRLVLYKVGEALSRVSQRHEAAKADLAEAVAKQRRLSPYPTRKRNT